MSILLALAAAQAAIAAEPQPDPTHSDEQQLTTLPPNTSELTSAAGPKPLNLTCSGGGAANKLSVAIVDAIGESATVTSTSDRAFTDQVDVRLFDGDDRIRLPRTMLPLLRGGKEGWFKLKNLRVDARSIRAKAAVNFINNPNVYIDRVTGTISISGKAGDYSGQCQVIDATAPAKF